MCCGLGAVSIQSSDEWLGCLLCVFTYCDGVMCMWWRMNDDVWSQWSLMSELQWFSMSSYVPYIVMIIMIMKLCTISTLQADSVWSLSVGWRLCHVCRLAAAAALNLTNTNWMESQKLKKFSHICMVYSIIHGALVQHHIQTLICDSGAEIP